MVERLYLCRKFNTGNMNGKQKADEKLDIQPLVEYLQISSDAIRDSERPDFILQYNDKIIGIEHTSICPSVKYNNDKKSSLATICKMKRNTAIKAYEKILAERNENILIDVKFKHKAYWNTEKHHTFKTKVINEIESLRNTESNKFQCGSIVSNNDSIKTEYIESIQLILDHFPNPMVCDFSLQYVNKITQEDFDLCVNKKCKKLTQYKRLEMNATICEYWLVVTINLNEPYEFWNTPYSVSKECGYRRIFLIQYGKVKELKL